MLWLQRFHIVPNFSHVSTLNDDPTLSRETLGVATEQLKLYMHLIALYNEVNKRSCYGSIVVGNKSLKDPSLRSLDPRRYSKTGTMSASCHQSVSDHGIEANNWIPSVSSS